MSTERQSQVPDECEAGEKKLSDRKEFPSSGMLSPLQVAQASRTIGPYIDPIVLDMQCHTMEAILQPDGTLKVPRSDLEHNNRPAILLEHREQHRPDFIPQQELDEFQTWVLEVLAEASTKYPDSSNLMKGDEESGNFIPLMWNSLDFNQFPPSAPQRRPIPILILNSLYGPIYEAIGLPSDPILRMFVLSRAGFRAP